MAKIGFIGVGNVRDAILNGPLRAHRPEEIISSAARQDKMEAVTVRTRVPHTCSNRGCVETIKYLILTVKPQYFDAVFSEMRDVMTPGQVVVSLAPDITISNITEHLGGNVQVVKAMPNTSVMLGGGITGVSYGGASYTEGEKETIRDIFSSCGRVELMEGRLMDAVGCVSGSSPAFMYMFIETLAGGGVKYGLPRKTIYAMAAQTVLGNARMILETGKHPGQLKDEVCSPSGTTIASVPTLEEYGLRSAAIRATNTCYEKARRMK